MGEVTVFGVMYLVSDEHWSDGAYTYRGEQLPGLGEVIPIEDPCGTRVRGCVTGVTPANRLPIRASQVL